MSDSKERDINNTDEKSLVNFSDDKICQDSTSYPDISLVKNEDIDPEDVLYVHEDVTFTSYDESGPECDYFDEFIIAYNNNNNYNYFFYQGERWVYPEGTIYILKDSFTSKLYDESIRDSNDWTRVRNELK